MKRTAVLLGVCVSMACDREPTESQTRAQPAARASTSTAVESSAPDDPVPLSGVPQAPALDSAPVVMPDNLPPPRERKLADAPDEVQRIFDGYGFPVLSEFSHVCAKRLMGSEGARTTFDVFASPAAPAVLVATYEKRLTSRGLTTSEEGTRWELPPGAPTPRRSLTIAKPSAPGRHKSCDETLPAGTKSVLTVLENQ